MSAKHNIPDTNEVAGFLRGQRRYLIKERIHEADVRLQVNDNGWYIQEGDASYDTDHSGHWGAGTIMAESSEQDIQATALDLIHQVEESIAQE